MYATEDNGVVKDVLEQSGAGQGIVVEYTHPNGWKYTTVSWHISTTLQKDDDVDKGDPIGTIANIASPHLHFGVQIGTQASGYGALPMNECNGLSPFPLNYIDTNDPNYVQYQ